MTDKKYFANIDGEQRGPFTLAELAETGVTPETYVWCKGMDKWRRADKVADVCRYWRQRLSGTLPEQQPNAEVPATPTEDTQAEPEDPRLHIRNVQAFDPAEPEPGTNLDIMPNFLLLPAILCTLLCMPVTGFIAIFFSVKARKLWDASLHAPDHDRAEKLRLDCYYAVRSTKMWIGISFFLGIILMSAINYLLPANQ